MTWGPLSKIDESNFELLGTDSNGIVGVQNLKTYRSRVEDMRSAYNRRINWLRILTITGIIGVGIGAFGLYRMVQMNHALNNYVLAYRVGIPPAYADEYRRLESQEQKARA